jgi:hypothetical protein
MLSDITPNAFLQEYNAVLNWYASNWSGVCSQLPNISKPNLTILELKMLLYRNKLIHNIPEDRHTNAITRHQNWIPLKLELANVGFYNMTII